MLNRVQEFREARSLTLEELAQSANSSPRFLAALEKGETVATVDVALKLARTLGVTVEELFDASLATPAIAPLDPDVEELFFPDLLKEAVVEELAAESVEESAVEEPAAESVEEPVADEPAAEPVEEPVAEEPVAEPVEEPVAEETAAESVEEPVAEEPVVESVEEPVAEAPVEEPVREKKPRKSRKTAAAAEGEEAQKKAPKRSRRKKAEEAESEPAPEPTVHVDAYTPQVSVEELSTEEGDPLFFAPTELNEDGSMKGRHVYAPSKSQTISSYYSKTAETEGLASSPSDLVDPTAERPVRFFDLFCGIGGFRYAANNVLSQMRRDGECVLSCDVEPHAQKSYAANFGDTPFGDVEQLPSERIPDFDLLFAGFPCQTFSIIGLRKGFADETKGSLFFQIARILRDKRPRAFVLENVRQLTTHDGGRTFEIILRVLQDELGYYVDWRVLNALDCGLPQKRERVVVVGSTEPFEMEWPRPSTNGKSLADILIPEREVPSKYYASPEIIKSRKKAHQSKYFPSVWHENKSGYVSSYPYSCALRAGASYNYLLVNGERRFTPLELLRLQGFPDDFKVVVSDTQLRKQVGNAAPVNLVQCALERFLPLVFQSRRSEEGSHD